MDLEIQGNAAVVTASSSGLGKASAMALAEEGANVVINGRDEERLDRAVSDVDAAGSGTVVGQRGDITDEDDVSALVDRALDEFGGIDHLVTSAGGPPSGSFMDTTDEDWNDAHELLLMSVVRLIRESAEPLRADGGGTIVNITSRSVKEAIDPIVLSNSVRMGVVGLEKTLSREFAPEVRANAVLPGPHETSRVENLVEDAVGRGEYDSYEEGIADRAESIPVGQLGDPTGLGRTVAFLSAPSSAFINGTTVTVDGGLGRATL
ncbi:SDR family oxidoreductase [Halorarum salinum]|uniref:SDR family oxidoreductase n=1 Tax=Halorarum salinum TaxID=2743089 RepID=A0A7D5LAU2_9EURY|nr:SDR family oxidoreductase [Halobaculum salinum]QLG61735.1 SDR family oxidoreductase [Halobaculum salinum]